MKQSMHSQSGFSLVTTLFILVVLALLGGYMAQITSAQHEESALSIQSVRAWYAANSGLEWVAYQIDSSGVCPTVPTTLSIEGFSVRLTDCTAHPVTEGGASYSVFDVSINAERGSFGSVDYVARSLRATLGGI